ncbi:hypothetical protein ACET3Z_004464 [Daucus carota]
MPRQKPRKALVLFPSKKHEAIDLSLTLKIVCATSTKAVSFKKRRMSGHEDDDRYSRRQAKRLRRFSFYTAEEEAEERLHGVCTKLDLYHDPWKIKKVLEQSDVNNLCRLMISKRMVQQHIVKVWERAGRFEDVQRLEEGGGVDVKSQFVSARGLKKGYEIGLFWCNYSHCFFFSVLARAPAQPSV